MSLTRRWKAVKGWNPWAHKPPSLPKICASQIGNHESRCIGCKMKDVWSFTIPPKSWRKKIRKNITYLQSNKPRISSDGINVLFPIGNLCHPDYLNLRLPQYVNSWKFCWWPFQDGENVTLKGYISHLQRSGIVRWVTLIHLAGLFLLHLPWPLSNLPKLKFFNDQKMHRNAIKPRPSCPQEKKSSPLTHFNHPYHRINGTGIFTYL